MPAFSLSAKAVTTSSSKTFTASSGAPTKERRVWDLRAPSQMMDSPTLRGRLPTSYELIIGVPL